jgi:hypothetical protein
MRILFTLRSIFDGPLLGLFLLGGLTRLSEWRGALAGATSGLCLTLGFGLNILFSKDFTQPLPAAKSEACHDLANMTGEYRLSIHPVAHNIYSTNATTSVEDHYVMSFMWLLPLGAATTMVVGPIASIVLQKVSPEEHPELDDELFISFRGALQCVDVARTTKEEIADEEEKEEAEEESDDDGVDEVLPALTIDNKDVKVKFGDVEEMTDFEC